VTQSAVMRFVPTLFLTLVGACVQADAASASSVRRQAWFYSTTPLRASSAPVLWCAFVTEGSAKAAANSDRFEPTESGWIRYRGGAIESLMVMSQSEDAYVEDSYTFGPDLGLKKVVRTGHYVGDPFVTATFRPDGRGHLQLTEDSRRALKSWQHATYFLEWPLYETFSKIPFSALIVTKPSIRVSEACRQTKS